MLHKLKSLASSEEKKRLLSNFFSLSVLQGANYILPLLTLPYLVRVLGVEYFGLLAFATATITYFQIFTDYGFNLTATRQISIHRDNKEKVIEIFSSVMTIKVILMFIALALLSSLLFFVSKFNEYFIVYYLTFGLVVGQVLFPIWFFQGMERMKYITFINIFSRLLFTILIFIFINKQQDYYLVPLLSSLGVLSGALVSLILIKKHFNIQFKFQRFETLKYYFFEAYYIFISNIAISLYTVSTTFILGLLTNNTVVGYFSAGDKIIQALKGLMAPVSQTIYPYISKKINEEKEQGMRFIRKVVFVVSIFTLSVSLITFISAEFLVDLLLGSDYKESIIVVKVLALMPFMIGLSNMFGIQTMLNFGKRKAFSKIIVIGSILNLFLSFILVPSFEHIGSAVSVLIVESYITLAMFIYLQKNNLRII